MKLKHNNLEEQLTKENHTRIQLQKELQQINESNDMKFNQTNDING